MVSQASLSFTISKSLFKFISIEWWSSGTNQLNLCHPLLLLPSIFPPSRSSPMSQLFTSSGQSIAASASASASVRPVKRQDWFPSGLTGLISLQSKRLLSLLQHHSSKASILQHLAFFMVQLSHPYMTTGKVITATWAFAGKAVSLLFNMLSGSVTDRS